MNYNFWKQYNPSDKPAKTLLMIAAGMIFVGFLLMQISMCRVVNYIYESGRLSDRPSLFCRVF